MHAADLESCPLRACTAVLAGFSAPREPYFAAQAANAPRRAAPSRAEPEFTRRDCSFDQLSEAPDQTPGLAAHSRRNTSGISTRTGRYGRPGTDLPHDRHLRAALRRLEQTYSRPFDRDTVNAARFITHLRYFFVRAHTGRQLDDGAGRLGTAIRGAYPEAYSTALKLQAVLELRLGQPLTEDEVTYLTLHVARMVDEVRA